MKNIFFASIIGLGLVSCGETPDKINSDMINNSRSADQPAQDPSQLAAIEFEETNINLGKIYEGESITQAFKFKNTGKVDLVINNASATCGCTKPDYPRQPIAPGAEGVMKVTFNSEGKPGANHKEITIFANTDPRQTVISFDVDVLEK
ncbi:MAG: DUF1573 domain-containing protein [Bacteroidia bacterium]|jgi:hypothetical protein